MGMRAESLFPNRHQRTLIAEADNVEKYATRIQCNIRQSEHMVDLAQLEIDAEDALTHAQNLVYLVENARERSLLKGFDPDRAKAAVTWTIITPKI